MNMRLFVLLSLLVPLLSRPLFAARAASDLTSPQRRQASVETGERLARRVPPPELPADLPSPFNPVGFDLPDPDVVAAEQARRDAAAAAAAAAGTVVSGPATDRGVLEALALRLNPSGTFILGGKPLLIIDRNRFEIGTKFIVTYEERDYELQLISIDRTTFTLRYRGEEITRPIKPLK
jgi:hypothetical protein